MRSRSENVSVLNPGRHASRVGPCAFRTTPTFLICVDPLPRVLVLFKTASLPRGTTLWGTHRHSFSGPGVGVAVGVAVGSAVGVAEGVAVGVAEGSAVGVAVASALGVAEGVAVGVAEDSAVGVAVGSVVGIVVGVAEGSAVGVAVGSVVGIVVGMAEGSVVGVAVGVGEIPARAGVTVIKVKLRAKSTNFKIFTCSIFSLRFPICPHLVGHREFISETKRTTPPLSYA